MLILGYEIAEGAVMMQRAFSFGTNLRRVRMTFGVSQVKWVVGEGGSG